MNLKKFLKPTKSKLILTFLIPLYLTYSYDGSKKCISAIQNCYKIRFFPLPLIILIIGSVIFVPKWIKMKNSPEFAGPFFNFQTQILHFILDYILPVIINYVLSCTIIYFYKKRKK